MKFINFTALGQVTLGDIGSFLYWLERSLAGEVTLRQMEEGSPIRTSKLKPALTILEEINYIAYRNGRVRITSSGKCFSQSQAAQKKAIFREFLQKQEVVKLVSELLHAAPSSHVPRSVVREMFSDTYGVEFGEYEISAFISWGQECELFLYDKRREVLFLANPVQPSGAHDTQRNRIAESVRIAS